MKKGILITITLALAACGSGGGGGGAAGTIGGYISNPPSMSTLPTATTSDSTGAGQKGGGTCGLAGRYGYCVSVTLTDTQSARAYAVIEENCTDYYLQVQYYTGANCTGSVYHTRLDHYLISGIAAHSSIVGGQNVDLVFVNRTERYSAVGFAGPNRTDYKECNARSMSDYAADTDLVSTSMQCGAVASITHYDAVKVSATGLFTGNTGSCTPFFTGSLRACTTAGARPTALQATGIPFWN